MKPPIWTIDEVHRARLRAPTLYRCIRCSRRARNRTRPVVPFTFRNDRLIDWRILPDRKPVVTAKGVAIYLGLCPRCKKRAAA